MVIIRLQRVGKKNSPHFRVVAADSRRSAKSGAFLEILGSYNPRRGEPQLKSERILYWISKGAKTSGTVNNLLVDAKIIKGPKVDVSPSLRKKVQPEAKQPAPKMPEKAPEPESKKAPEKAQEEIKTAE